MPLRREKPRVEGTCERRGHARGWRAWTGQREGSQRPRAATLALSCSVKSVAPSTAKEMWPGPSGHQLRIAWGGGEIKESLGWAVVQAQGLLLNRFSWSRGRAPLHQALPPRAPSKPPRSHCLRVTEIASKQTHRIRRALGGGVSEILAGAPSGVQEGGGDRPPVIRAFLPAIQIQI